VVREVVEGMHPAFEEHGISLNVPGRDEPRHAEVDREHLGRALGNLLDNARRFTPPGGEVSITLSGDEETVVIRVEDNGPGIEAEALPHVFERFYQGELGVARGDGSGLGLAIVAGVVRAHGGDVQVDSTSGGGTRFELHLPVRPPTEPGA